SAELIEKINLNPYGISGHQQIIADFIEAIQQDRSPAVTGEDGKNALKLVLAVYEASERKGPVQLKEL
ncbi:Gfo/Idh/MocA family oxidoreductase, partial [Aneurinibacillus sp. UBA3580]|uniref:Gfo/Idh/MocA family oxidoreductase n=1 Tax=Aneurinibacillus sp. UBA3580 TaxID=1946041 RepID=UPI00257CB843